MFHFLRHGRLKWRGDWPRSCLDRNSVIVYWILNNWLDDCVRNVGIFKLCNPSTCTHEFCVRAHDFFVTLLLAPMTLVNSVNLQLVRRNSLDFCESPARTHDFCEFPARTHECCGSPNDLICALQKYTPIFLIRGSLLSPYFKKGSLARCFSSVFALVTDNQDRLCHLPPHGSHTVSGGFRSSSSFDACRNLGVFFRPHLGFN